MTGVLESAKKYYKINVVTGEAVWQKAEGLALCKKAGIKENTEWFNVAVHRVKAVCQPGDLFKTLLRVPLTSDLNTVRKTCSWGLFSGWSLALGPFIVEESSRNN